MWHNARGLRREIDCRNRRGGPRWTLHDFFARTEAVGRRVARLAALEGIHKPGDVGSREYGRQRLIARSDCGLAWLHRSRSGGGLGRHVRCCPGRWIHLDVNVLHNATVLREYCSGGRGESDSEQGDGPGHGHAPEAPYAPTTDRLLDRWG